MDEIKEPKEKKVLTDAEKLELYEQDPLSSTYFAVTRKLNELTISLNETVIDITNEEDKVFDRFMKFVEKGEESVNFVLFLETKLKERFKVDDVEKTKGSKKPILEEFVTNKNNGGNR